MPKLTGTGEFNQTLKIRISATQLEALRTEGKSRGLGLSATIRRCIDLSLDPEKQLEAILATRTTPYESMVSEIMPELDEMEHQELQELFANGQLDEAEAYMTEKLKVIRGAKALISS